ncbi:BTAD domain-containing putative transcriptional regulator [Actinoplanes sp. NPDC024001]|uniref:BTAD domain-containing putative transcriptional regulator n=1 Tax=Actinoplanes sp. NPDC024001 TaxID=3154598 RepID=UPI0033F1D449
MIRLVAAVRAVMVAGTLVVGVPLLLMGTVGSPVPEHLPTAEQFHAWAQDPLHPRFAGATVRTLIWLLWAMIAVIAAAALAARVWRWPWARVAAYLPGPLQGLAATLLGAAAVASVGSAVQAQATSHPSTAAPQDHHEAAAGHRLRAATEPQRAQVTVTVRRGDTLTKIAKRRLGDADRWPEIYRLNRGKSVAEVGGRLRDPDVIQPGWRLALPIAANPKPRPPAVCEKPAERAPAPPPTASPSAEKQSPAGSARWQDGVSLPGGWISIPFAASLIGAATIVWLRRRRHAGAGDPPSPPLPAVMTTLKREVRRRAPQTPDPVVPPTTVADFNATPPAERDDPPQPGPSGLDLAGLAASPNGRGLIGPGAEAAARALLVATLSAGTPADPDAQSQVIVPSDTLTTLLGAAAPQLAATPRLHLAGDFAEVLTRADELLLERRRLLEEHDAEDLAALRAAEPYHPPMPPVLLLATAPPADQRARLLTTVRIGAPLQITAVLLGDWPDGDTLTVNAGGTTRAGRLAVLDAATTVQLLAVLREAHAARAEPEASNGNIPTMVAAPTAEPVARSNPAGRIPPSSGTQPVRVRLLGKPEILGRDGNSVTGLRHHARELLVYLAVHRDGARLPDIMEAFWPRATVRRAAERLSTEAANLRRHLRQAAGDKSVQPVINTGGHYHLDPDLLAIDLWQLSDALRGAAADPAARLDLLRRAVDTHTGILAEGFDYDWIEQPREHFRRLGVRARVELAELVDPEEAARLLGDAACIDPINEELARRAIRATLATGDEPGAALVLHRLRQALADIDEEPSAETVALARRPASVIKARSSP